MPLRGPGRLRSKRESSAAPNPESGRLVLKGIEETRRAARAAAMIIS